MDRQVAKCLLISKVLAADGMMTENERAFLEAAMTKMSISAEDRRRILDLEGWDEAEGALAGISSAEKSEIVSQLVDAASSDGRLSPLESAMVKRISTALGV